MLGPKKNRPTLPPRDLNREVNREVNGEVNIEVKRHLNRAF